MYRVFKFLIFFCKIIFILKVCKCLDINNEIDYFGLKYQKCANDKKHLWLNLRNPIEHQVNIGSGLGSINCPVRLEFRVKFWVPPHLLLEESTRFVTTLFSNESGPFLVMDKFRVVWCYS